MKFKKYNSITNHYDEKFIEKIKREDMDKGNWTVSEKLHGANLSIWYDGKRMRFAKRTSFLDDDESFYGLQNIKNELEEKVKLLRKQWYPHKEVVVYGEIIGGSYPHKDVPKNPNAKKVQAGIWYSPDNLFYTYDLVVDGQYKDFGKAMPALKKSGFSIVPFIKFGVSFEDALATNISFDTKVPIELGLPQIKDNLCEGVVIRPEKTCFLKSRERVVLKKKNKKFLERAQKKKRKLSKKTLTKEEQVILDTWNQYITQQRYDNVVSKLGEVTKKDFGKIMGLFGKDAYEEFSDENHKMILDLNNLESSVQSKIKKLINKELANIVRENLIGGAL